MAVAVGTSGVTSSGRLGGGFTAELPIRPKDHGDQKIQIDTGNRTPFEEYHLNLRSAPRLGCHLVGVLCND